MTGNDVLRLACGELGVKEQPMNSNRVKYNAWYYGKDVSGSAYPWCMAFVQWCYHQAGADLPLKTPSCGALLRWYMEHDPACIVPLDEGLPGDIVIFDFPGGASTDHTGLLEGVGKETVTTIDGNTGSTSDANGGCVMRRTRSKSTVRAVIRPREKEDTMDDKQIYEAVQRHAATIQMPASVKKEYEAAVRLGLTDGSAPGALVPAWRSAVMAYRACIKGCKHG